MTSEPAAAPDDAAPIHSIDLLHGFVLSVGANRTVADGFGLGL